VFCCFCKLLIGQNLIAKANILRGNLMKKILFSIGILFSLTFSTISVQAQTAPTIRLQPVLSGLSSPVFITNASDGSRRLFIVEQGGRIKVAQPGATTVTEFLNISSKIISGGERGLLGLAFHPQYSQNRRFFVYYTRAGDGAIQIAEYQVSANNPNVADTAEKVIITIPHPNFTNHNGGTIAFGADGYLYAAPGDGGGANDPDNNAQNINVLLGKMLRIDINVPIGSTANYLIPPDNPFAGATAGADEIYAFGLRNPYRFSFDRTNNQLWTADVGQGAREEVDIITRGGNYGWRIMEGTICTPGINPNCTPPAGHIPPIFEYSSAESNGRCSITGGNVYRGARGALPNGGYVYGDYCSGEIFLWNNNQQTVLLDTDRFISSFGEGEDGEIYVVGLSNGTVDRIERAGAPLNKAPADFDGDGRTDTSVFRQSNGVWYFSNSSNNAFRAIQFGQNGDIPVPEDFDGDNITDIAVFRPSNGTWYLLRSSDNSFASVQFGANGDIPAAADFDGDAKADFTVFRPSNGVWYRLNSGSNNSFFAVHFGQNGDEPVQGDYDGDGRADICVWRPSNGVWYRLNSTNNAFSAFAFGTAGDLAMPGDFDGDNRIDQAVFRFSNGVWYLQQSSNGFQAVRFGLSADVPVVGDYDGDGKEDIAVWRTGNWYILRSSNGSVSSPVFGTTGDLPVPTYDRP
jgi:glucose/arabinose dehydrogenase